MQHLVIHLFIDQLDHVSLHPKTFYDKDLHCCPGLEPSRCFAV